MMFPDCRNDECYNEDFLSKTNREAKEPKEYYDTRRFMCTGVKEHTENTD